MTTKTAVANANGQTPDAPKRRGKATYVAPDISFDPGVWVTPDIAAEWLARNPRNRSINSRRVAGLARAITNGEWKRNGDCIAFDSVGNLLNGQHRLSAIIEADTAVELDIVRNVDPAAQDTFDTGRARTFSDLLTIRGERYATTLAAATRMIWAYELTGGLMARDKGIRPSHQELLAVLDRHPGLRESMGKTGRTFALSNSAAFALHYLFSTADRDDTETFFDRLSSGIGIEDGDPIWVLRERLIREQVRPFAPMNVKVLSAFTINAFNAWRYREPLPQLYWRPGGANPTPFPAIRDCTVPILGS